MRAFVVCPLAVALALVGAGGRLSFCLALRLSVCVVCYGKRNADALALLGVHTAAVLGGLFVFFLTLIRII